MLDWIWIGVIALVLVVFVWIFSSKSKPIIKEGPFKGVKLPEADGFYDVVIAGCGPAGSTCSYFLATNGIRVAVLERKSFPRDKICSDCVCEPAINLLDEMGVLKKLLATGEPHLSRRGGFISPRGYVCIGGPVPKCRTYAIKRMLLDETLAKNAKENGVNLFEDTEVVGYTFSKEDSLWTITTADGRTFKSRMFVAADGSNSRIGKSLGIVTEPPSTVCSRHYLKGKTHNWTDDGTLIYTRSILPGYFLLFKHSNGDVNVAIYILPGGAAQARDIPKLEKKALDSCSYMSEGLGGNYEWKERLKTAPLRVGGVRKSFAEHLLLIGDAAGHIDPLTGEGIHTSMIGGKIAAKTLCEMFEKGNFSEESCSVYHDRWMAEFGNDFYWSSISARIMFKFPLLVDAMCAYGQSRGKDFLELFGQVMTGVKSKREFLRISFLIPITFEILKQIFIQYVLCKKPMMQDFGADVVFNRPQKQKRR